MVKVNDGSNNVRSFQAKHRVFGLNYQYMNMFKFVRCSKNDVGVCSMFDKMEFEPSLSNSTLKLKRLFRFGTLYMSQTALILVIAK